MTSPSARGCPGPGLVTAGRATGAGVAVGERPRRVPGGTGGGVRDEFRFHYPQGMEQRYSGWLYAADQKTGPDRAHAARRRAESSPGMQAAGDRAD